MMAVFSSGASPAMKHRVFYQHIASFVCRAPSCRRAPVALCRMSKGNEEDKAPHWRCTQTVAPSNCEGAGAVQERAKSFS